MPMIWASVALVAAIGGLIWATYALFPCKAGARRRAWNSIPQSLRSADRYRNTAVNRFDYLGFRLARTLNPRSSVLSLRSRRHRAFNLTDRVSFRLGLGVEPLRSRCAER